MCPSAGAPPSGAGRRIIPHGPTGSGPTPTRGHWSRSAGRRCSRSSMPTPMRYLAPVLSWHAVRWQGGRAWHSLSGAVWSAGSASCAPSRTGQRCGAPRGWVVPFRPPARPRGGLVITHAPEDRAYDLLHEVFLERAYLGDGFYRPAPGDVVVDGGAHGGFFAVQLYSPTGHPRPLFRG